MQTIIKTPCFVEALGQRISLLRTKIQLLRIINNLTSVKYLTAILSNVTLLYILVSHDRNMPEALSSSPTAIALSST
jgi:hypothetical protein